MNKTFIRKIGKIIVPLKYHSLVGGIISYLPNNSKQINCENPNLDPKDAWYCYCYWLKHLTHAFKNGLSEIPNTVAELGPGKNIGMGIAALLSGTQEYYGLDIISHANKEINIKILQQMEMYFKKRAVPFGFKKFPDEIINNAHLNQTLNKERVTAIYNELLNNCNNDDSIKIRYYVPWQDEIIKKNPVDMIVSNFVLEHVDDLSNTYSSLYYSLKPGGFISNQINFDSHETTAKWNGHWAYSDTYWQLIRGRKTYLINRMPCSTHIDLMKHSGFKITCEDRYFSKKDFISFELEFRDLENRINKAGISRANLNSRFNEMSEQDFKTREALIQGVKPQKLPH